MTSISIGENCLIGSGCKIYDTDFHPIMLNDSINSRPIVIGNDVFIGANVTILKGVHIGDGAVVGAGSIVTKSIPAKEVWGGVPAQPLHF